MSNIPESHKNQQFNFNQHFNVPNTYRCYLRTPDMRAKIHTISTDTSIQQLKQQIITLFRLPNDSSNSFIRLIINDVQLTQHTNLAQHLYNNAIIHVLISTYQLQDKRSDQQITIKLKQPPTDCPILQINKINLDQTIKKLKLTIIKLYKEQAPLSQVGQLSENQLYLVYGGRILKDEKKISEFELQENGIVYVVNGRIYSKVVSKEEAEKRIQQVKKQYQKSKIEQLANKQYAKQEDHHNQNLLEDSNNDNIVFSIVQNMVYDEDSDVQGETQNSLPRSQTIIQRYDSKVERNYLDQEEQTFKSLQKATKQAIESPIKEEIKYEGQQSESLVKQSAKDQEEDQILI